MTAGQAQSGAANWRSQTVGKTRAKREAIFMLELRCIVCHERFDFSQGETAVVLRHIAYGYDFVHERHAATALGWIFVDPDYDRPEFGHDARRYRVLDARPPEGWAAVMPDTPARIDAGYFFSLEPLDLWVLVEYQDGSRHLEGLVRDPEWRAEPGGAEFPEGEGGVRDSVGYAAPTERTDPFLTAQWEAIIRARYRGEHAAPERHLPPLGQEHAPTAALAGSAVGSS
jgi:hypothetical protein